MEYPANFGIDKHKQMIQWLVSNGARFDGVEQPVRFATGEDGVAASRDLPARTAIMYIPNKCILSVWKALNSELKPIYLKHWSLFEGEIKCHPWSNILSLYVCYEMLKKEQSFFYPYLGCLPQRTCHFTYMEWPQQAKDECRSAYLSDRCRFVQEGLQKMYAKIKTEIFEKEEVFLRLNVSEEEAKATLFYAYAIGLTRVYGWSQPSNCLVPLADMFNHSHQWNCSNFIVCRKYEQHPELKPIEYTIKKEHVDLERVMGIPSKQIRPGRPSSEYKFISNYLRRYPEKATSLISKVGPEDDTKALRQLISTIEAEQLASASSLSQIQIFYDSDEEDYEVEVQEVDRQARKKIFHQQRTKEIEWVSHQKNRPAIKEPPKIVQKEEPNSYMPYLKEEVWDWLDQSDPDWSFVVTTEVNVKKGQQLFINYGSWPNRIMMQWYGFCPMPNKYDSYVFRVHLDSVTKRPLEQLPSHMMFKGWRYEYQLSGGEVFQQKPLPKDLSQEFKLKGSRINLEFVRFLRAWLLDIKPGAIGEVKCTQIPTSLTYERFVLSFYLQLLENLINTDFKDEPNITASADYCETFAREFRKTQHWIVHEHRKIVQLCLDILSKLDNGSKIKETVLSLPFHDLTKVLEYTKELEEFLL